METLKFLQNKPLKALTDEFGIKVRDYPDCSLAVLNYNQIDSPKYHPIVRECRGLIIDYEQRIPVARSFPRFFNLNEWVEDPFDFDNIKTIEEKADGSLIIVYWWENSWNIATRGTAFGEANLITGTVKDFRSLFIQTVGMNINEFMSNMSTEYSYSFELCTLYNQVVKLHTEPKVYLTGAFNVKTGEELDDFHLTYCAGMLGVLRPQIYSFPEFEVNKLLESFADMHPTDEGYVLKDIYGNRLKVKNPAYVDLHHIKGEGILTSKRICKIVFRGETDEVVSYFPDYRELIMPYQDAYDTMIKEIDDVWESTGPDMDQKDFAMKVKDLPYSSILFSMKKGLTKEEAMSRITDSAKVSILEQIKRR
jgi:hypothetical protein